MFLIYNLALMLLYEFTVAVNGIFCLFFRQHRGQNKYCLVRLGYIHGFLKWAAKVVFFLFQYPPDKKNMISGCFAFGAGALVYKMKPSIFSYLLQVKILIFCPNTTKITILQS